MEKLGLNISYLLFYVLNFLLLLVLLRAWVYKPILGMLNQRKDKVTQSLKDAEVAAEARANAEQEAHKVITAAQTEANQRIVEAVSRAEKSAAGVLAAAETERNRRIQAVQAEATLERDRLLGDLRGQVAALAIAAANKLIGESLDEQRQRTLIDEFFSGVKAGRVLVLEGADLSGAAATVTSALPLTPAEQATVQQTLVGRLGAAASVKFKVDPGILGGLVVRVGDQIVDGSVAGQLEGLRVSLK